MRFGNVLALGILTVCLEATDPGGPATAQELRAQQPNIILVMTDDQGYGDLGCHGHPFLQTPNLDSFYEQSTRFTSFHVSPTCSPTRAALMSGRAAFKNGVTHTIGERERMSLDATTIAEVLNRAGYTTGIFGKWHLGDADPYQPENRGFDEVFIHGAGGIGQNYSGSQGDAPGTSYFAPIIKHNGQFVQANRYCTDVFFRQALGWIKAQHVAEEGDRPFFAYIAPNAAHSPYLVDESYSQPYADKCDEKQAAFFGMIANIDENMGFLLEKLQEWGLEHDTLVIFMTDNGTAVGRRIFNAGMNGGKGSPHEGGSRVPLFMRWPGRIPAGVDIDRMTRHYDLFPTLAEIAGAELSEDLDLDGRSLVPLLKDPEAAWDHRYLFFHNGRWPKTGAPGNLGKGDSDPEASKYRNYAVRSEQWRLVNGRLYDLEDDPGETKNVAEQHPEVVEKMKAAFDAWWDEVRPMMVNEDAPLDVGKPFRDLFRQQAAAGDVPDWIPPDLQN